MATVAITATKQRPEKVYIAYGRIESTDYAVGDTLKFNSIAAKEIAYAEFVSGTKTLKIFSETDVSSPIAWDINNASFTADIDYVIHYVHGTANDTIQLTVSSSS